MSTAAYALVWTPWYTPNMSDAILPDTWAVFMVGTCSTLVYCYDVRHIYDTKKYYVQEEWNVTKSAHQYHTPCCIYHVAKKVRYIFMQYVRGFIVVWKRQDIRSWQSKLYCTYCCCVTRTCTGIYEKRAARPENYMVLVLASKLTWLFGWSKWT